MAILFFHNSASLNALLMFSICHWSVVYPTELKHSISNVDITNKTLAIAKIANSAIFSCAILQFMQ